MAASPEPDLIVPSHVGLSRKRGCSEDSAASDSSSRPGSAAGLDPSGGDGSGSGRRGKRQSSAPPNLSYQVFMATSEEADIPTLHDSEPRHNRLTPLIETDDLMMGSSTNQQQAESSKSCSRCQVRNVWCSQHLPCDSCLHHGDQDLCDWSDDVQGQAGPTRTTAPLKLDNYPYPSTRPDRSSQSTSSSLNRRSLLPILPQPTTSLQQQQPRSAGSSTSPFSPRQSTSLTGNSTTSGGPVGRVRVRNSCAQCHDRKIRCSRTFPCTGCTTRGNGLECNWEGGLPVSVSPADENSLRAALVDVESRANALRDKCLAILATGSQVCMNNS